MRRHRCAGACLRGTLNRAPSILDIGCGTARDLDSLSRDGVPECLGIDFLPEMIAYAKGRPHLDLRVGDMRNLRLKRTFDAILCMGSAFMYALTNEDVDRTLETFAAHAHKETILILDINNAAPTCGGGGFRPAMDGQVETPEFAACIARRTPSTGGASCSFGSAHGLSRAQRTPRSPPQRRPEDFCEYRLFFPMELDGLLSAKGFQIVGMFDNMDLRESNLTGPRLYVAATEGKQ